LKRTQEVLRERPEAFSRPGKTLELLDSFDTAVSGIRHIIRNLAKSVSNVNNSKDGFVKSSKFVWNESELRSLLEDMRAQRSLIDSVINSIQMYVSIISQPNPQEDMCLVKFITLPPSIYDESQVPLNRFNG
jgi:hypothetical protein